MYWNGNFFNLVYLKQSLKHVIFILENIFVNNFQILVIISSSFFVSEIWYKEEMFLIGLWAFLVCILSFFLSMSIALQLYFLCP